MPIDDDDSRKALQALGLATASSTVATTSNNDATIRAQIDALLAQASAYSKAGKKKLARKALAEANSLRSQLSATQFQTVQNQFQTVQNQFQTVQNQVDQTASEVEAATEALSESTAQAELSDAAVYEAINAVNAIDPTLFITQQPVVQQPSAATIVSTYIDPTTGDVIAVYSDGTSKILSKGTKQADAAKAAADKALADKQAAEAAAAAKKAAGQSAYDLLYSQFKQYGLESLVEGIKNLITSNVSPSEFAIRLQDTDAYKKRFAANQDRIKAGLRALTPAEYIGLEDQYQNIMRNYGLPASYYTKDAMGTQAGFNKFIANDVSATELEDRIATAQKRVINADVNVKNALRQFYPDITDADILAYTLDPSNALENIKRKVTAAEIGGAALAQGLQTGVGRAEELAKYGVTKAQAQQGYQTIGEILPTGQKLADIYEKQQLGPYSQLLAEQEVFGTQGAVDAARKRRKLVELEKSTFMGSSGMAQGAMSQNKAYGQGQI